MLRAAAAIAVALALVACGPAAAPSATPSGTHGPGLGALELGGGYLPGRCLASSAGPAGGMAFCGVAHLEVTLEPGSTATYVSHDELAAGRPFGHRGGTLTRTLISEMSSLHRGRPPPKLSRRRRPARAAQIVGGSPREHQHGDGLSQRTSVRTITAKKTLCVEWTAIPIQAL